jgi:hypothetical protein
MTTAQLFSKYANSIVKGMHPDTLKELAAEKVVQNLQALPESKALQLIQGFAPHLLDS